MKPWYKSRTIWLNLASLITSLAALALGQLSLLGLSDSSTFWWTLGLTAVVNVGNIVLRFDTSDVIGTPPKDTGFTGEHT